MMSLLSGIRVLDFSTLLPGPYASMMLADLGADVLRIESPSRVDICDVLPPFDGEHSTAHSYLHRSKRSIALDLKKQECIEIIKRLVLKYDVVLEQFRPGVMDRLGIGYEALKEINPGLIFCSITGYGQDGPYRDRPGHDINYLSIAGISSYTRRADASPLPLGIQVADVAGGSYHAVMGILAAIVHRQMNGVGQSIDVSMTDAAFSMNAMAGAAYLGGGVEPEPESSLLNGGGFYDYYRTKDERYISIGSLEPQFLKRVCESAGHPELIELGLDQNLQNQKILKMKLADIIGSMTYEHWVDLYQNVEACVEPVLTFSEAVQHPQIKARKMVVDVPSADKKKTQKQLAFPIKFSDSTPVYKHMGCGTGEHTDEVLLELGFEKDAIEQMRQSGLFK